MTAAEQLECCWLGRVPYSDGLALQEETVRQRVAGSIPDRVLLLEHEPVYTIGRTRDRSSLGDAQQLPHPVVEISRGGQATFHGPGQLVGYPIVDLKAHVQDLHVYLRCLESALIAFAQSLSVPAARRDGLTGVWVENRKLASIGVGVRQWITMHGFALNVCGDLAGFHAITPCGLDGVTMTSLEREGATEMTVEHAAQAIQPFLADAIRTMGPH